MRIAVDQNYPSGPFGGELLQTFTNRFESIARHREKGIGLHEDDEPLAVPRQCGGLVEPGVHGLHAWAVLEMTDVVVMAGEVERDEDPALRLPAHVLTVFAWLDL